MTAQKQADTAPEIALRSALHRRGLRFRKHIRPLKELRCQADVVFVRQRVAIFVDGCFWHGCPEHWTAPTANAAWWQEKIARNSSRDRRNDEALAEAGWIVARVWEHESPDSAAARVETVLNSLG